MKVLLVEDEQKIADFVCSGLTARGAVVTHCADGNAGFEAARQGGYDAIVLDLMLPGRDGLAVLSGLRAVGVLTPVILLTTRNELGDRIEGLNQGADDYMAKPFFVEELHVGPGQHAQPDPGTRLGLRLRPQHQCRRCLRQAAARQAGGAGRRRRDGGLRPAHRIGARRGLPLPCRLSAD